MSEPFNRPPIQTSGTVGSICFPVEPLTPETSLGVAASDISDYGLPGLPVVENGIYLGMITEQDITRGLVLDYSPETPISELQIDGPVSLYGSDTVSHALRTFAESSAAILAVTDSVGHLVGVITPSKLLAQPHQEPRPKMVGGMATPLGVYLSNGAVTGGVNGWALILTGSAMFLLFAMAQYAVMGLHAVSPPYWSSFPWFTGLVTFLSTLFFLLAIRLTPIAGYHAAEHMTVHAIERGEPLTLEVVKRMPRVHPRCGTNLAVGAMIFLGIQSATWLGDESLRLLLGLLTAVIFWRRIGEVVQLVFTTRPPSEKQIMAGIHAGKMLIKNFQHSRNTFPMPLSKLLKSGIFHIMAGSMITALIFQSLQIVLKVPQQWWVIS